jgi:Icc-related predicted phosphoesterase
MEFQGHRSWLSEGELPDAEKRVRFNGFYPYVCDPEEVALLEQQPQHLDAVFKTLMSEQLTSWLAIAQERLEPQGVPCFVMPGNDDDFFVDDALNGNPYVANPDLKVVPIGPYQLLSCSWTPPTPWNSPGECAIRTLIEKVQPLVALHGHIHESRGVARIGRTTCINPGEHLCRRRARRLPRGPTRRHSAQRADRARIER